MNSEEIRKSVTYTAWTSVNPSVWGVARIAMKDAVKDDVWKSVVGSIGDSVGDLILNSVWRSLGSSVRNFMEDYKFKN